jgi:hypothetical protein
MEVGGGRMDRGPDARLVMDIFFGDSNRTTLYLEIFGQRP